MPSNREKKIINEYRKRRMKREERKKERKKEDKYRKKIAPGQRYEIYLLVDSYMCYVLWYLIHSVRMAFNILNASNFCFYFIFFGCTLDSAEWYYKYQIRNTEYVIMCACVNWIWYSNAVHSNCKPFVAETQCDRDSQTVCFIFFGFSSFLWNFISFEWRAQVPSNERFIDVYVVGRWIHSFVYNIYIFIV